MSEHDPSAVPAGAPDRAQGPPAKHGAARGPRAWPWDPDQTAAAQLAIASLQKFFIRSLSRDGRLQLETLFCTVGALTGFAAQHALRQESLAAGRAETDGFRTVESASGERFF